MPPEVNSSSLVIRGARTHNLKNVDLTLPAGQLIVFTGVSGSGKSSLAFDTIYAEGQRRYVESLSAYARQFLERMEKPDVDRIDGICPSIAIRQKNSVRNPRSTVGTVTEIHDYMRLLFARVGRTICRQCGQAVIRETAEVVANRLLALPDGTRLLLGFDLVVVSGGASSTSAPDEAPEDGEEPGETLFEVESPSSLALENLRRKGFGRLLVDGQAVAFEDVDAAALKAMTTLRVVVDRLKVSPDARTRITDSVETSYAEGGGAAWAIQLPDPSTGEAETGVAGSGQGGDHASVLRAVRVPHLRIAVRRSAAAAVLVQQPVRRVPDLPRLRQHHRARSGAGRAGPVEVDQPGRDRAVDEAALPLAVGGVEARRQVEGHPPRRGVGRPDARGNRVRHGWRAATDYEGVRGFFRWLERKKYKVHVRVFLSRYRGYLTCPDCHGTRLRREARDVQVGGVTIDKASARTVREAERFFATLTLTEKEATIADKVLKEIRRRLGFLRDVGLDYLTLDRLSSTLSGGEAQRINLATSLGSALVGTLYVLDEPSIGLHTRDNARLITILRQLRDQGNTVIVVEHDADMIAVADHLVDMGLGAGEHGGRVVYSGSLEGLTNEPRSLTAKYLRGELSIPIPVSRRKGAPQRIRLFGATEHNLKGVDIEIPLNTLTCVTGVSGSGKSTLVHDVLYAALKRAKGDWDRKVGAHQRLEGHEFVSDVVLVDQTPIGRTPRSNPVTYLKAFDPIRELFATTKDAKSRGLTASHFSFNVPGGRCEACQGEGEVRVEMQFLADVFVPCEHCDGRRFKSQVLDVRYRGKNITQVLDMTVREALSFFASTPKVLRRMQVLDEIGLGYLRLGQPATTLSGGEAQRIKIAAHLSSHAGERLLYILDEPTTGLHFDDIAKLLAAFRKLLEAGHTLIVIEHNMDVIKVADWIIDLGPEGGEDGGRVLAMATPEQVAHVPGSHTGKYIKEVLSSGKLLQTVAR